MFRVVALLALSALASAANEDDGAAVLGPTSLIAGQADMAPQEGMGAAYQPGSIMQADDSTAEAIVNATEEEQKKKDMVCLCKKVKNMPASAQEDVLAAGWKKRAIKCADDGTEDGNMTAADAEKCTVIAKPKCKSKDDAKDDDQCARAPRSKQTAKDSAAAEKKAALDAEKTALKSKCLSKFCADEDNLNKSKKPTTPPTSTACYDKCNKSHCVKLFDMGWEHWYECIQTCIGNCFKVVD